jgi:hypothetical protein
MAPVESFRARLPMRDRGTRRRLYGIAARGTIPLRKVSTGSIKQTLKEER